MKKVLAYDTITEAEFAAGLLQAAGIPCEVRNVATSVSGGLGIVLPLLPEVWSLEDGDLPAALEILERKGGGASGPDWKCASCGTANERAFDACWSCGVERSSAR